MAILDASTWQAYTGRSLSGPELTALVAWCEGVSAALAQMLLPVHMEPLLVTAILDAPLHAELVLPHRPVRQIVSLRYNERAEGVADRFTPETELVPGQDYALVPDDPNGWSLSGRIRRLGQAVWGVAQHRIVPATLAGQFRPIRGAVRVEAEVGYPVVPAAVQAAAVLAVTKALQRRWGYPASSESWNGYAVSWSVPPAWALVHEEDVLALLRPFLVAHWA